jgi:hypothetical protein
MAVLERACMCAKGVALCVCCAMWAPLLDAVRERTRRMSYSPDATLVVFAVVNLL